MRDYGLPAPSIVEKWLFEQEEFLMQGIESKALPKSQRTDGFGFLKGDAEWLSRFWKVYMQCPIENGHPPSIHKAIYHFNIWYGFVEQTVKRCEARQLAEELRQKLFISEYPKASIDQQADFMREKPAYHARRKLREEFSDRTKTGWRAGRL